MTSYPADADALKSYPILYVDDDHGNRVVMKHNLGQEFALLIAKSGEEALEVLARETVAVLLTDQRMPGMTGVDLAERVLRDYPDVVRVIITAYSDLDATIEAINRARVSRFIKKPWTPQELVVVMRESVLACHQRQLITQLEARLRQLDRVSMLALVASGIAHDLRQPLAVLDPNLRFIEHEAVTLLAGDLPGAARDRVMSVRESVRDAISAAEKVKTISAALAQSLQGHPPTAEKIDLRRVVESAVSMTRGTIMTRALLRVELPDRSVETLGSEGRLLQLIINLLLNAYQAIPAGASMQNRVTVNVAVSEQVSLAVADTGCGISPKDLEHIFTPYFTTKGNEGTGLGLAICKQIVEEMQGSIGVESTPGKGTRFVVRLPPA